MLAKGVRSSQGRLIAYRKELDRRATEAAAERAQPNLFRSTGRAAVAAQRKYLDAHPVYKDVPVDMGPCDGWRLLIVSERSTPARLVAEAFDILSKADDDKPIERWGRTDFARLRRSIEDAFAKLDEAAGLVADLLRLASPANQERIAAWARECKHEFEIRLPEGYGWPATPALDALRSASATGEKAQVAAGKQP
ncbi:MAG: hypothetical protein C0519_15805 [Hyphomicrobium sp.]|nr:hypothetical protein [Hyphomicrobium sp.]PPD05926.1 MAG: hypothetical protein CTY28_15635 [Hyphomicrobium sp.]